MYANERAAKGTVFRIPPIKRRNDEELDKAIADLEKRGFYLVSRGANEKECKDYHYRDNRIKKHCYAGATTFSNVWAIMEKVN